MRAQRISGFTLPELLMGMGVASLVAAGIMAFTLLSSRLMARNLAVNHSHLTVRLGHQRLAHELHESYSAFRLVDCLTSTTFQDVTAEATTDTDSQSGHKISTSANGVRFRALAGGPFKLSANAAPGATSLTFDMAGAESADYIPEAGDKIFIPLIRRELDITAVTSAPGAGKTSFTVTTATPIAYEFTKTNSTTTAAYFFRKMGFSVFQNRLRFHKKFPGTSADIVEVCTGVTSEKPFSFLCPGGTPDDLNLRVSLESYDRQYSALEIQGGTVTLQTIITPRTPPNLLVQTN